ncbi:MAG: sulfatase-like hydrolase/transferase [Cyanobacteriota bacterium]
MIKQIKDINQLLEDFYYFLITLNKKEYFFSILLTGFITGIIIGLIVPIETTLSYELKVNIFNKLKALIASTGIISFSGLCISIVTFLFLMCLIYVFIGLTKLSKKGDNVKPYKILILCSLVCSAVATYIFVYFFIENPSDILVDLLKMNDIFIAFFYILFILVALLSIVIILQLVRSSRTQNDNEKNNILLSKDLLIKISVGIFILILLYFFFTMAANTWQINQWLSETIFVSYNKYWVKFLNLYSNNLIMFKINLFLSLSAVFIIVNYILVYIINFIITRKDSLAYFSIMLFILFVITFIMAQNIFSSQLYYRFRMSLVIILLIFISYYILQLALFSIYTHLKRTGVLNSNYKPSNKTVTIFIISYIVFLLIGLWGLKSSNEVRAITFRYNTFAKLALKWNYLIKPGKNTPIQKSKLLQTVSNKSSSDNLIQDLKYKPNIILIVVDAMRYDFVQENLNKTDNTIGKFAKNSFNFKNAYAQTTYTVSSISSIFSSKLLAARSDIDYITLAEILKQNGYYTYALNTFVKTFNFDYITINKTKYDSLMAKGFETNEKVKIYHAIDSSQKDKAITKGFIKFLKTYNKERPLFAYIHYAELHTVPPSEVFSNLLSGDHFKKRYQKALQSENNSMNGIFEALKETGFYNDSIIIVTTDHGEASKEHGDLFHVYNTYQEIVHVPLFIKLPKQQNAESVNHMVSLLDLMPTILELIGYDCNNLDLDGLSFVSIMQNNQMPKKETFMAIYMYKYPVAFEYGLYGNEDKYEKTIFEVSMIDKNNKWKYIHNMFFGYDELYDLKTDPGELNNVIDEQQQIGEQMLQKIQDSLFLKK